MKKRDRMGGYRSMIICVTNVSDSISGFCINEDVSASLCKTSVMCRFETLCIVILLETSCTKPCARAKVSVLIAMGLDFQARACDD